LEHQLETRMDAISEKWWSAVSASLDMGQPMFNTPQEFDQAVDHIVRLLSDAVLLLENGSHASGAFMAITAIEETAKAHIAPFRKSAEPVARRKDPLFSHTEKHNLAMAPTVAMGKRLRDAMGEPRMRELMELGRAGEFARIREAAIYVERANDLLLLPCRVVSPELSRDLILLAIEVFDDALAGLTNHSYAVSARTDELFRRVAGDRVGSGA